MPTARIEYQPDKGYEDIVEHLADELPRIVAPQMNIGDRELHDGGVGESEILVDATEYSRFARNVNSIQITVIAHRFDERVTRLDEATEAIKQGVMEVLRDFDRNLTVGVSIWLVEMGYATYRDFGMYQTG
jgi:hypothetical protein